MHIHWVWPSAPRWSNAARVSAGGAWGCSGCGKAGMCGSGGSGTRSAPRGAQFIETLMVTL
jgi:hypothetical protein